MNDKTYENYLAHYGILGMRWGIRKEPEHSGNGRRRSASQASKKTSVQSTKERRKTQRNMKRLLTLAAATVGVGTACYLAYRYGFTKKLISAASKASGPITKNTLKNVTQETVEDLSTVVQSSDDIAKALSSDKAVKLKPGTTLRRVVGYDNYNLSKESASSLYTTFLEGDSKAYVEHLKDWAGTGKRYEVSLDVVNELNIPDASTAQEIFNGLLRNETYKDELAKTLSHSKTFGGFSKYYIKQVVLRDPNEAFTRGVYSIVKGGKDADMLKAAYQKRGYTAIQDYFDKTIGMGGVVKSPLIVFNKNDVKVTGEKFVKNLDWRYTTDIGIAKESARRNNIAKIERNIRDYDRRLTKSSNKSDVNRYRELIDKAERRIKNIKKDIPEF